MINPSTFYLLDRFEIFLFLESNLNEPLPKLCNKLDKIIDCYFVNY